MRISYNWLSEYLPVKIEPERLSRILTSIGLEVERLGNPVHKLPDAVYKSGNPLWINYAD